MIRDNVRGEKTGAAIAGKGLQPLGSRWTPRLLLLGPALMQCAVTYLLLQDLRDGVNPPAVLVPLILLALGGAGGIAAGIFGRSGRLFRLGILCALLGFALPAAIQVAATPVDKSTSVIPVLGAVDAEGVGTVLAYRTFAELPFWCLYTIIVLAGYLGARRTHNGTTAWETSSGPRQR